MTEKRHKSIQRQLSEIIQQLYEVQAALAVASAALKQQNCELDADIANVLRRSGSDRLGELVEKLEAVRDGLVRRR